MKATFTMLCLSAALLAGCATTQVTPPRAAVPEAFIGYITPHVGASSGETFKVTTNAITSPRVRLARDDDGFRGVAAQSAIDLRVEGADIVGALGGQPIHLRVYRGNGWVWVMGLYGGRFSSFSFPERAPGTATACGQAEPWMSLSSSEQDAAPSEPTGCGAAAVETLAHMRTYLHGNEALALLSVMFFSGASSSAQRSRTAVARKHFILHPPVHVVAAHTVVHHH